MSAMIHCGTQLLNTERLTLRRFSPEDAPAMFAWSGDERVSRYLRYQRHTDVDQAHEYLCHLEALYCCDDYYHWAIVPHGGEPVGSVTLSVASERDRILETGYCLRREAWGNGYCTEALGAVLSLAFRAIGANRVQAAHAAQNPASGAVMRRCGMQYEGMARQYFYNGEAFSDCHLYAVLKSDQ